jgi:hypothetical protein
LAPAKAKAEQTANGNGAFLSNLNASLP